MILHATLAAQWRAGDWRGLLVRGPSGAGKSSLALQLMQQGWRLVADDRVVVWRSGGRLFGRAPDSLFGLIEARGVGVHRVAALAWTEVRQVIDAAEPEKEAARMPEPCHVAIDGVSLPRLELNLHAPTSAASAALWCGAAGV